MRKYLILTMLLLLLNSSFGYYFEYIKITESNPTKTITFKINKVENYTYKLSFVHYGTIKENMQVNIYLNGNLVYVIDDSNDASPAYKKNVSIDITDYLKDGENVLKVDGVNLIGNGNYHPYYVLKDVYINEPTKTPIDFKLMIYTLLIIGFLIYRKC
ncbi:hypothetical protein JH146_0063 [Methanocaldococcus bathoardescens]|uniref:Uncharacterized protein n=1 Tax=Methanocaldococcus bathoardescens TaxID=1301915 RepID=A0A076LHA2_9EURY|nr:hypothetical protein [Methanocaldococcus bathoardescens]AIJ04914.1 hypothetical protein JH146_0063 [Methanocaldococcus bathoardescens]